MNQCSNGLDLDARIGLVTTREGHWKASVYVCYYIRLRLPCSTGKNRGKFKE